MEQKTPRSVLFRPLPLWLALLCTFAACVAVLAIFVYVKAIDNRYIVDLQDRLVSDSLQYGSQPALSDPDFFKTVKDGFIAQKASFIEADLTAMTLRVYADGAVVKEVPIKTKGREGSWWETPAGLYKIETKETNHFSSFGHVYQPWSMVFQGNFFIHGWPYEPDGTPVATAYSGGCIRLATPDAKAVYDLVKVGTPVLVFEKKFSQDDFTYQPKSPDVSAKEYLAADLDDNFVFASKDATKQVPIASVTKLVTALVSAEYINLDKQIAITPDMIVPTSKPRLQAGEKVGAYALLYPLLMESSNEAAEALARSVGREQFVALMNQKAAALGMTHTHFTDPSGAGDGNVSTAEDLFQLAKYITNNRSFVWKITAGNVSGSAYEAPAWNDLQNFNLFDGEAGFVGGKVGKTTAADETMVALFDKNVGGESRPIVYIVLGSGDNKADVTALSDYQANHYNGSAAAVTQK